MGSAGLSQVTTAQDDTSGNADPLPGAASEERFKVARRGYDRGQVDEFAARSRRDAVGMRNRLIHGYREVDFELVWKAVTVDLPSLVTELEQLLRGE